MVSRRGVFSGLVAFVACAPAIVRAASLLPVRHVPPAMTVLSPMDYEFWHTVKAVRLPLVMFPPGSLPPDLEGILSKKALRNGSF